MASFQLGGLGGIPTRSLLEATIELRDEAGQLLDTVYRDLLTTWDWGMTNPIGGVGDSLNSDQFTGSNGSDLIFWDWQTIASAFGNPVPTTRYFLPAGDQISAIDIFSLAQGDDILNLTYDATSNAGPGAIPYGFNVTAYGGIGNDLIMSGAGNDSLYGGNDADTIYGAAGDDVIDVRGTVAQTFVELAFGGSGADTISGDAGNDSLFGGADNDTIEGNDGLDYLDGGLQDDVLFGGGNNDLIVGGGDNDTLYGGDGLDELQGGLGFRDRLFGGAGNDQISDVDGVVLISGGAGDDMISSNFAATWAVPGNLATILGGGGADEFSGSLSQPNLNLLIAMDDGSADAADGVFLQASAGNSYNTINATLGGGDDSYRAVLGTSVQSSGARIDIVFGDAGNDTIYGGAGSDTLYGGVGFLDYLVGGAQTAVAADAGDVLVDADGVVYARGGEGDDVLNISFAASWVGAGGNASDLVTLDGNGGSDIFTLASLNVAQRLVINADDGTLDGNETVDWTAGANSYAAVTATMGGGNDLYVGAASGSGTLLDTVYGGDGADTLYGGAGIDHLYGGDGADTLFGDADNDTLYGGIGTDTLYGGTGFIDRLYGDDSAGSNGDSADLIIDTDGVGYARGGQGDDSFNISFAANWTGAGGNASDLVTLDGGGGADSFVLTSGNSAMRLLINGDDGSADAGDRVDWSGQASSYDTVTAILGAGNDTYIATGPGGAGNLIDIVYGGVGTDTLFGGVGDDTLFGSNSGNSAVDGGDTLFGRAGNDTLAGGFGVDSLFGEGGNDVLIFNADNTVTGDNAAQDYVQGWDGETQTAQHSFNGRTINWSFDIFDGGASTDSLVGTAGDDVFVANTNDLYIDGSPQSANAGRLVGVEIVLLGAGADIFMANDPTGASASGTVYTTALTVYGGDGQDVVYTGSGNDRLVGDLVTGNADILSGGLGNDTIWGDLEGQPDSGTGGRDQLYGGGGSDTIFGGAAADSLYGGTGADTLDAGAGQDFVFDIDNAALFFGGDGSDYFLLGYRDASQSTGASRTGNDAAGDGDDRVYIWVEDGQLQYNSISVSMGAGNDVFISANVVGGNGIDRISGESGSDVISSWGGNDIIDGGDGNDGLWGGAGGDTIYGGPGTDYLYAGSGDNDTIFGGTGIDYYYFARTDGAGDQIFDDYRGTPGTDQQSINALVVIPVFDAAGVEIPGTGVLETDYLLTDNVGGDDMVHLVDIDGAAGTMWRLDIVSGAGAGSSVTFDQRDVYGIFLVNNDASGIHTPQQYYEWDPNAPGGGAYVYVSG